MISLITAILEVTIAAFSFFTKRAARKESLREIMDEFSQKHDNEVKKNIKLREEYEELKKKIKESAGPKNPS